ncbi:hypothetical protein [Caloramator sp.]|uniref:Cas10/Cmr2 second palm domain-containing protein n=1 Tax=Caloramator sp. TaxID=1871330 RepID=UPI0025C08FB5|nr:hypothetical protein [Caloramator sp.]
MKCLSPQIVKDYDAKVKRFREGESELETLMYIPYQNKANMPSLYDVLNMYVLIRYITFKGKIDRNQWYKDFFKGDDEFKKFIIDSIEKKKNDTFKDINVDLVKGSIYKIKKYFLENDKIKDIRGGSYIIDYLNINRTKEIIKENFIEECVVYAGGGNVILLLPEGEGERICKILEEEYTKVTLTCMNAFEYIRTNLNEFFYNFNAVSRELNDKLEERKKLKIYPINPTNELKVINEYKLEFKRKADPKKECKLCNVRDAHYVIASSEGNINVCSSCHRKTTIGREVKGIFKSQFEEMYKVKLPNVQNLSDIKDNRGYVAVIYGDGNNMGNVVMNIKNPFELMYFSRRLDEITRESVYQAIYEVLGENAKFEVIALGGDDVFIIVPAERSLEISNKIIKNFDSAFNGEITMSIGVCISKYNTPIKNMFNIAQDMLKSAKKITRKSNHNTGSIDVVVLESNDTIDFNLSENDRLFPIFQDDFESVISVIKQMKKDKDIDRSQLYKLRNAANTLDNIEFELFYLYQQERHSKKYTEYVSKIYNKTNGVFTGLLNKNGQKISPWNDIVTLYDYIGGE